MIESVVAPDEQVTEEGPLRCPARVPRWLVATLLVVAVGKVAFLLLVPHESIFSTKWCIDDSFIFMRIARNLAGGKGFSFDGLYPTTGAPLAWTVLIAPLHLLGDRILAAKLTLALSAVLGTVVVLPLWRVASALFGALAANLAAVLYLFNPVLAFQTMNGMETFAFVLVAVLSYGLLVTREASDRRAVLLGAVCGLLVLIKIDGLVWAAALLGAAFWRDRSLRRAVLMVAPVAVALGIIVAWNYHISGEVHLASQRGRYALAHYFLRDPVASPTAYLKACVGNVGSMLLLYATSTGSAGLALIAVLWALVRVRGRGDERRNGRWELLAAPVGFIGAMFALYTCYQWYFPDVHGLRYIALPTTLLTVFVAALIASVFEHLGRRRNMAIGLALASVLALGVVRYRQQVPYPLLRRDPAPKLRMACWVAENAQGQIIAAKDHGIIAYLTDAHVVDLAGIIEPPVIPALLERRGLQYIRSRGAELVILPAPTDYYLYRLLPFDESELERLHTVPGPGSQGMSVYRLRSPGPSSWRAEELQRQRPRKQ